MEERAALRRIAQIDYRYRHIVDLFIPIERFVNQRISQRSDDKNDHYARIAEDALKFRDKGFYYRIFIFGHDGKKLIIDN